MCHLKGYRLDRRNDQLSPPQLPLGRHGGRGAGRDPGLRFHLQQPRCRACRRGLRQGVVEFRPPAPPSGTPGRPQTLHARGEVQGKRADQQVRRDGQLHPVPPPDGRAEVGHPLPARRRSAPQGGAALHRLPHPGGKDTGRTPPAPDRQGLVAHGHRPQRPRRGGDEDLREPATSRASTGLPGRACRRKPRTPTTSTARSSTRRRSTSTCFTARPATPRSGRPAASISWTTARDSRRGTRRTRPPWSPAPDDMKQMASELWKPWMDRHERVKGDGERYVPAVPKVSAVVRRDALRGGREAHRPGGRTQSRRGSEEAHDGRGRHPQRARR